MKRLRNNDKGMSLIEVLVAVTILAIVVTPFLHSFITTANTNRKAKNIHKATVLAQSIMESCKAESLEDIALQFDYPASGFRIVAPDSVSSGDYVGNVMELRPTPAPSPTDPKYSKTLNYEDPMLALETDKRSKVTSSIYWETGNPKHEFKGQTNGKYYFGMQNVKQDISSYDALIEVDANPYRSGGTSVSYNDMEYTQIPIIDDEKDALCQQKAAYTENALSVFSAAYPTVPEDDIRDAMKCYTTINIDKTPLGGGAYRIKVSTLYHYTYKHGTDAEISYDKTQENFDNGDTGNALRCVYLYYYPLYRDSSEARDIITINNPSGVPIDLYLFKQLRDSTDPHPTTAAQEANYRLNLYFNDVSTVSDPEDSATKLHSNLKQNIESSTVLPDTGYVKAWLNGTIALTDLNQISVPTVLGREISDKIFDLKVSIYEKGAAEAGYPADKLLATMDGSKLK